MLQHHALPTSGVKTPAFRELFGTAEAVPSRELFMRWFVVVLGLLRKQERPNEPHGDQEHVLRDDPSCNARSAHSGQACRSERRAMPIQAGFQCPVTVAT